MQLTLVGPGQALPPADLVILPGSKSVRADLAFLRAQGWDAAIARHLRYGGKLLGICGGLQMLGERIGDPTAWKGPPAAAPASACSPSTRCWSRRSSCATCVAAWAWKVLR